MRTIVLVVALALRALETGPDLGADTDTIALLDVLDGLADLDRLPDNLVAYADRGMGLAPAAGDGVDIGTADAAALNLDVDVVVAKDLGLELHVDSSQSHWVHGDCESIRESARKRTVCFLNSLYLPSSLIMNPSNSSG